MCTPDLYSRGVQRAEMQPNNPYMTVDWWFAAAPDVLSKFKHISNNWPWYVGRARELRLSIWSHHVWMLLVHDVLNMTAQVAFMPGVRIGLARHVYPRLLRRSHCSQGHAGACTIRWPLGNFVTDPTGECPVLRPSMYTETDMVRLDPAQLRTQPIPSSSNGLLFGYYEPRFASMAEQCSWARHPEPITCCGKPPHVCGTQECPGADHSETNWLAAKAARAVPENVTVLRRKVACQGAADKHEHRYPEDCGKRRHPKTGQIVTTLRRKRAVPRRPAYLVKP